MDCQPNLEDICTLVCVTMFHTERLGRRDQSVYKDQDIDFEHKQIYPGIHYRADIRLSELKIFYCLDVVCSY